MMDYSAIRESLPEMGGTLKKSRVCHVCQASANKCYPDVKNARKCIGCAKNITGLYTASQGPLASSNDCAKLNQDSVFYKPRTLPNGASLMEVDLNSVKRDPGGFAMHPVPQGMVIQCRITRDKRNKNYYLQLELNGDKVPILGARKRMNSYVISKDPTHLSRHNPKSNYLGKLKSTLNGLHFTLYDNGVSPNKKGSFGELKRMGDIRQELVSVNYEANIMGMRGPRKMKIIIPRMGSQMKRVEIQPTCSNETIREKAKILEFIKMKDVVELINKKPCWHNGIQSYVLNFKGRVTTASVKNFQIIHPDNEKYTIMQFGKAGENIFSLDISYPLCPMQAFGICLSSFCFKLACQ